MSTTTLRAPVNHYLDNPMTTRDRRLGRSPSAWVRSFACEDVRPLIVCRGPIRKEAIDTFRQMGIEGAGILLSEKDSIVYTHALAPEVRTLADDQIHRIRDYSGATKDERVQRMREIVAIAKTHGYTHVFSGYGFMAEDPEFVRTLEDAGLVFIGPASSVQLAAGLKDEAKRTALANNVSVTPGIDDATRKVILTKYPTLAALRELVAEKSLDVPADALTDKVHLDEAADSVLDAGHRKGLDLYTIEELAGVLQSSVEDLLVRHPGKRLRLKAIGGGGGKGQRILAAVDDAPAAKLRAAEVPGLVREILNEVKAGGVGDNKNILVEMNIEETRHNEIQLLGNGSWCIALGGRDCSLQMHEQKLLELSLTQDGLAQAIARAEFQGHKARVASLIQDQISLGRMEAEAERFGLAVGLNSASTFECIVEGDHHYFMEVNTRIQVEHRVTELCYRLVFKNPANPHDPTDAFEVTSLVEAMVLIARHGTRLPRPERTRREVHSVEARINATNRALEPHAGGLILAWSENGPFEIRDDQGICAKNPDTGSFMHYRLAGAYDSNIALMLTYGPTREVLFERLIDMLRRTRIRGNDLHTNLTFHVGLAQWFAARDVWAKPTTRFVTPYLAAVGLLAQRSAELDLPTLWGELQRRVEKGASADALPAIRKVFALQDTLVRHPIERLLEEPHLLSAFLSRNVANFAFENDRVIWTKNPLEVLSDLYWLIGKEYRPTAPAANVIWDHDHQLLNRGCTFYRTLHERLGIPVDAPNAWRDVANLLGQADLPERHRENADLVNRWPAIRAAHAGHQAGPELLAVLIWVGLDTGFFDMKVESDGRIDIPARLSDKTLQDAMKKVLAPPPAMRSNEIVAVSGGMFYAQEAPDRPPLVAKGSHFKAGDPLYIIEVMKMFNRVHAPFSGTIDEVLVSGGEGTIVQKGQPLFRVTPDEPIVFEDPIEVAKHRKTTSLAYLDRIRA